MTAADSGNGPGAVAALPTVAIIGRPNVGKSTLFNRLTRSRNALVADVAGLTRDPRVGKGRVGEAPYIVVDTGGVIEADEDALNARVAEQALAVAEDCDAVVLVVDGRAGLTPGDEQIAARLRRFGAPVCLAVNKCEGMDAGVAAAEFARLGFAPSWAISASHGDGVNAMMRSLTGTFPAAAAYVEDDDGGRVRIAVVGRPNVGKSTLVNRILGDERMITFDQPGTTRDAIDTDFERHGRPYTIIDTAGLRRKSRASGVAEKFSAVQTLRALERAHVVIAVIDARDSITEQDMTLLGLVLDSGRSLVIAINKWDAVDQDQKDQVMRDLDRRLRFLPYAEIRRVSALHGSGVGDLFRPVDAAHAAASAEHRTNELSRLLAAAVAAHPPPLVRGRRIKLRYAHMGGRNPPTIVVHGNQVGDLPGSYQRYLENYFREALDLVGTPIRIELRQGDNPYAGRRNKLSKRQVDKRRRLMRHVKKR